MDTYVDDLAELTAALDLPDVIHVRHSTGGGEVMRYIGQHRTKRIAKAVLNWSDSAPDAEEGCLTAVGDRDLHRHISSSQTGSIRNDCSYIS